MLITNQNERTLDDEDVVYVVSAGRRVPVPAGLVLSRNKLIDLPFPTDQTTILTPDDLIAVVIHAPDEGFDFPSIDVTKAIAPTISAAQKLDYVFDRAARATTVASWALVRGFSKPAVAEIRHAWALARYLRAKGRFETEVLRLQTIEGAPLSITDARRSKRFQRGFETKAFKLRRIKRRRAVVVAKRRRVLQRTRPLAQKRGIIIAGVRGAKRALGPIAFLALVVDVILVSERVLRGYERAGLSGAIAGAGAGAIDVVSLGLVPESKLQRIETGLEKLVREGQGAGPANISVHPKDSAYYAAIQALQSGLQTLFSKFE